MTRICAPIALFVYARRDHTRRTVEALRRNLLAEASELIIFSDAPKRAEVVASVEAVRNYIRALDGFKSISIVERESNLGLAASIIGGVSRVCETHGRVIVLEDDLVTSPFFLSYMNDALDRYADTPRVAAISGYHPPFDMQLPETFFQRDAECWGWATWKRAWASFNPNGQELLSELKRRGLSRLFDLNGSYPYARMLKDQIAGRNDSWAVRWRASVFLKDMLSLYPLHSLVWNIGLDGSGTHGGAPDIGGENLADAPVRVEPIPLIHSDAAFRGFVQFNSQFQHNSFKVRLLRELRRIKSSLTG
jgi:hypothetical protein